MAFECWPFEEMNWPFCGSRMANCRQRNPGKRVQLAVCQATGPKKPMKSQAQLERQAQIMLQLRWGNVLGRMGSPEGVHVSHGVAMGSCFAGRRPCQPAAKMARFRWGQRCSAGQSSVRATHIRRGRRGWFSIILRLPNSFIPTHAQTKAISLKCPEKDWTKRSKRKCPEKGPTTIFNL